MQYRRFGRTDWKVSEIGYGMWGMAGWSESDEKESNKSLDKAIELGCNFFDTAWGYGEGLSEQILGRLVKRHPSIRIYTASKIPPGDWNWPPKKGTAIDKVFPSNHIIEYTEKTLKNLGLEKIDLIQFHVWEDEWANQDEWKETITKLKKDGKIEAFGLSVNRWEPENCLEAIKTNLVDSIQTIYNIFDQAPEDKLFPLVKEHDVAIIARVPFDEGTLTGTLTKESKWPEGDWRNTYFVPENLNSSVDHANALMPVANKFGMTMPEMALKFILNHPQVCTTIPGMRKLPHVEANLSYSTGDSLGTELSNELKQHRWDREPTEWSQ